MPEAIAVVVVLAVLALTFLLGWLTGSKSEKTRSLREKHFEGG